MPPDEWVDNRKVTVVQRMSMSGWWLSSSATTATASTSRMPRANVSLSMARTRLSASRDQPVSSESTSRSTSSGDSTSGIGISLSGCSDLSGGRDLFAFGPVAAHEDLRAQPGDGVVLPVDHALLHRDDR